MPAVVPIVATVASAAVTVAGPAALGIISATAVTLATVAISVAATVAQVVVAKQQKQQVPRISTGLSAQITGSVAGTSNQGVGSAGRTASRVVAPTESNVAAQQTLRTSDGNRRRVVGIAVVAGGSFPVWDAIAEDNSFHQLVALAHGRSAGFLRHYLDGRRVTLDASNRVNNYTPWNGLVTINTRLGGTNSALSGLVSAYGPWTNAHRCHDTVMAWVRQFPVPPDDERVSEANRVLEYSAMIRGGDDIYDPRTGETAWTANAALIFRWWLTHEDGGRLPVEQVDEDSFRIAADICDELIDLPDGSQELRYRCHGTFFLTEEPIGVGGAMLANMDGYVTIDAQGRYGLRIGNEATSDLRTFTENMVHRESFRTGTVVQDHYNSVQAFFNSAKHDYQRISAPQFRDPASISRYGLRVFQMDLRFCPSEFQAQRLAKIKLLQLNATHVGEVTVDLGGMNAPPGSTIVLGDANAWTNTPLRVEARKINAETNTIDLQVRSINPEESVSSPAEVTEVAAVELPEIGAATPTPEGVTLNPVVIVSGGANTAQAIIRWNIPASSGLTAEGEIAVTPPSGGTPSYFGTTRVPATEGFVQIGGISEGQAYTGRLKFIGASGVKGASVETSSVVLNLATALLPPPAVVVAPSTIALGNSTTISLIASASSLTDRAKYYSNDALIADQDILPGDADSYVYTPGAAGTYEIECAIEDTGATDGVRSTPITLTVT